MASLFSKAPGRPHDERLPRSDLLPLILLPLRDFIRSKTTPRWQATETTLRLWQELDPKRSHVRLYLRPRLDHDDLNLDFAFSGAAGMSDTSALLLAHWADRWNLSERDAVESVVKSMGLAMMPPEPSRDPSAFFPTPSFGYAHFYDVTRDGEEAYVDGCWQEGFTEEDEALLGRLAHAAARLLRSSGCLCQLCRSDFDESDFFASALRP